MRYRRLRVPLSWPCKDTGSRWPSENQEESPNQNPTRLAPWSWTSSLQNCEINFCFTHRVSVVFCYSSPAAQQPKPSVPRTRVSPHVWVLPKLRQAANWCGRIHSWCGLVGLRLTLTLSSVPRAQVQRKSTENTGQRGQTLAGSVRGSTLKLPTLARHHSNHLHELFYDRRSW